MNEAPAKKMRRSRRDRCKSMSEEYSNIMDYCAFEEPNI